MVASVPSPTKVYQIPLNTIVNTECFYLNKVETFQYYGSTYRQSLNELFTVPMCAKKVRVFDGQPGRDFKNYQEMSFFL